MSTATEVLEGVIVQALAQQDEFARGMEVAEPGSDVVAQQCIDALTRAGWGLVFVGPPE